MSNEETIKFKGDELATFTERGFQPILKIFLNRLDKFELQPIDTLKGKSVKTMSEGIDKPFLKGFIKPYSMEKCEKICLTNCILMDKILVCAIIIIPDDDHDFPMLSLEWSETETAISLLADFIPVADPVITEGYREKYLDPLDESWTKYKGLPGMSPNRFAWARMLYSPYYLSGHFSKDNDQDKKQCLEIIGNYIDLWLEIMKKSDPVKDESRKKILKTRKDCIRKIFRDNDEGSKTMSQILGQELIDLLLICNF